MLLKRNGQQVALAAEKPSGAGATYDDWVAADSSGPLVAWAENGKDEAVIVAFDTGTMREVGRKQLACGIPDTQTGCPRPYVASNGIVFILTAEGTQAWDPVADTVQQVSDGLAQQAHNKVLTTFIGDVAVDRVAPGWEQARRLPGMEGLLSYDGGWLLDANGDPKVVNWRNPDQTITYHPPGRVEAATFDTDGSVLVVTNDSGTYTGWDCALGGRCDQVVAPSGEKIRLVAWDT